MYNRLQNQQDEPIADDFKFYGNYRGEVVDNIDPLESGRVKVQVFGVFDGIPKERLPWANYTDPFMGGLSDIGSTIIPDIGTHVWCFFEGGNHHLPVYFGGAPAVKNDGKLPDIAAESRNESEQSLTEYKIFEGETAGPIAGPVEATHNNGQYPSNKVIKTKQGIVIEIDDSTDNVRIRVKHPSGTQKEIDNSGNVYRENIKDETNLTKGIKKERTTGDQYETVMGNETTHIDKSREETIGSEWNVGTGSNVNITIENGDAVITCNKSHLNSSTVELGTGGFEPLVLGTTFKDFLNAFFSEMFDTHTHPTGVGPSGPPQEAPATQMSSSELSDVSSTE